MTIGVIAGSLLGIASAVHVYWVLGGKRGFDAAIPHVNGAPTFVPGRGLTFVVALMLACIALLALWRDGVITLPIPFSVARALTPLVTLIFLARAVGDFRLVGFTKKIRGSRFARQDDLFYSPLCVVLALCFGCLSLTP
jgi:hypothetical protein